MSHALLVVEDSKTLQFVFRELCQCFDYEVKIVGSAEEALAALAADTYSAIVMDLTLPAMTGLECTREIRRRELGSGRHTPIIGMTAHATDADRQNCLKAGMDDYLAKPFETEDFRSILERWAPHPHPDATAT